MKMEKGRNFRFLEDGSLSGAAARTGKLTKKKEFKIRKIEYRGFVNERTQQKPRNEINKHYR